MHREDAISIVKLYMQEFYTQWKIELVDQIIHPECAIETISLFGPAKWMRGRAGALKRNEMSREAFPDSKWEPFEFVFEDEKLSVLWRLRARHEGKFFGIKATGREIDINGMTLFIFRDNLIYKIFQYMDSMQLVSQLSIFEEASHVNTDEYLGTVRDVMGYISKTLEQEDQ